MPHVKKCINVVYTLTNKKEFCVKIQKDISRSISKTLQEQYFALEYFGKSFVIKIFFAHLVNNPSVSGSICGVNFIGEFS